MSISYNMSNSDSVKYPPKILLKRRHTKHSTIYSMDTLWTSALVNEFYTYSFYVLDIGRYSVWTQGTVKQESSVSYQQSLGTWRNHFYPLLNYIHPIPAGGLVICGILQTCYNPSHTTSLLGDLGQVEYLWACLLLLCTHAFLACSRAKHTEVTQGITDCISWS